MTYKRKSLPVWQGLPFSSSAITSLVLYHSLNIGHVFSSLEYKSG